MMEQKQALKRYVIVNDLSQVKRPETPDRIQAMFTSIARRYDLANTLMSFRKHYSWKRLTAEIVEPKEGQLGIDVCAGTNDIALHLAKKVGPSGKVYALDFNKDMQEIGRYKAIKFNLHSIIENIHGDAEQIPFEDNSFDFLTIGTAARHLRVPNALAEWYRVLKPGARMACLEFYAPPNRIRRYLYNGYLCRLMPKIGLLFTLDKIGSYDYLHDSIKVFYTENRFKELMEEAGFINCNFMRLCGGIACIHWGVKPQANLQTI